MNMVMAPAKKQKTPLKLPIQRVDSRMMNTQIVSQGRVPMGSRPVTRVTQPDIHGVPDATPPRIVTTPTISQSITRVSFFQLMAR